MSNTWTRIALAAVCLLVAACRSPRAVHDEIKALDHGAAVARAERSVGAPPPPEPNDAAGRLSLPRMLRIAAERSPRLLAAREAAAGRRERRAQVTALPDPVLRLGWYAEEIETRTGPQRFVVGLTQSIPWPEKLSVAGDVADLEADQARVRTWIVGRDVLVAVAKSYHELDYLVQAERTTADLESLWTDLVARAAGAPEISAAEIARAETRREQARYDREVLRELAEVERERLRAQLSLPRTVHIADPIPVTLPELALDLEALHAAAVRSNQEILLATLELRTAAAREELAALSTMPDFSVGGRYVVTDERGDADPTGNGDDPVLLELGITLPLQRTAKNAAIAEARRRARAKAFARDAIVQGLRADLAETYFRARNEARLLRLHEGTLVPQAEHAAREAEALAAAGGSGLAGLIETVAARHQVLLGALRARADYALRLADLERLIGTPLERIEAPNAEDTP